MPFPEFWVITGIETWNDPFSMYYRVHTDIDVYLVMHWTYDEPGEERLPQRSRGTTERHNVKRYLRTWYEDYQAEYGDTNVHTYKVPFAWIYKTAYIRFEGFILGDKSDSRSPIFTPLKRPLWEPWDAAWQTYHPWVPWSSALAGIYLEDDWLKLRSYSNWQGGERCYARVGWPVSPSPLTEALPRYCLTNTRVSSLVASWESYMWLKLGVAYGYWWHLYYYFVQAGDTPPPYISGTTMRKVVGDGHQVLDLHADVTEIAESHGWAPPIDYLDITGVQVDAWRHAYQPPGLIEVDQLYIDFRPEISQ